MIYTVNLILLVLLVIAVLVAFIMLKSFRTLIALFSLVLCLIIGKFLEIQPIISSIITFLAVVLLCALVYFAKRKTKNTENSKKKGQK